jgi:hypothetical protein
MEGARGTLTGALGLDGAIEVAGEVHADLADPIFVYLGLSSAHGAATATFEARGNLPEPHVKAALRLHQARYQGIPYRVAPARS